MPLTVANMKTELLPNEQDKINQLIKIREHNNRFSWLLCDYLNDSPRAIHKELIQQLNPHHQLSDEFLYYILLTHLCGLDIENNNADKQFANDYFRESVKELSIADYQANPYYRNIHIPEKTFANWKLTYDTYQPYEAFIYDDIILKSDFREIPRLGFMREAFSFPVVMENNHEWMAIKPNEIATMQPAIDTVQQKVVTFGLGLGYFVYMASEKENVQQITVVERDRNVIQLFENYILPQFAHKEKVILVCADAFDYLHNEMNSQHFEYAFVDLWHDTSDGLPLYLKLKKEEYRHRQTRFLYWIEESILSALRWNLFDGMVKTAKSYNELSISLSNSFLRTMAGTIVLP